MITITIPSNIAITSPASALAGCTIPNKQVIMSHCRSAEDSMFCECRFVTTGWCKLTSDVL